LITVLHLISSLNRGGRERQLSILYRHSDGNKIKNYIICFNKGDISYIEEYDMEADVFFLKSKNLIKRLIHIRQLIKELNPDVLWTWGGFEAGIGLFLSVITCKKHINGSIRHGIVRFNKKQVIRMILLHLSRYRVANSKAGLTANHIRKGFVIYNGIDKKFFEVNKSARSTILYELNIPVHFKIFISVANLVPYKDYYTVIKALGNIHNELNYDFHYIIVGEGPERKNLESLIKKLNLNNKITLTGRRNDIRELLSCGDVFIHSSRGEGCSNAILEAMAAGLPVIATDTGGTPEIVEAQNGICFEFQNESQLKCSILKLYESPGLIKEMGKNSRKIAIEKYSIDKIITNYVTILNNVLGNF